jgi:NitT/TauT family transport system ATP-binding protein
VEADLNKPVLEGAAAEAARLVLEPQPPARLRIEGLNKTFSRNGRTITVLDDINLDVRQGEFMAFVGASGCGKTTLLRIVDGLVDPDDGAVFIDGHPISGPGADRGFVFQSDCLLPWLVVKDNVAFGLEMHGIGRSEARRRAQSFIDLVGLNGFEASFPYELSGGMKQRVNLARALAIDPEVLLMDEPFAALDAQTRELMQRELLRIWNAARKTVLFVTHQIDEAVYLADRVCVMTARPGRISELIDIDLPRPRSLEIKRTPEFAHYVDQIWRRIEKEVEASMA